MPNFSLVSCKVRATVFHSCDSLVSKKIEHALLLGSTTESPISVKMWERENNESLTLYLGIIVLQNNAVMRIHTESLASSLMHVIPKITGTKDSPLTEVKIIVCDEASTEIISSFCAIHNLDAKILTDQCSDLSYWSIFRENNNRQSNFKASKKPQLYQ